MTNWRFAHARQTTRVVLAGLAACLFLNGCSSPPAPHVSAAADARTVLRTSRTNVSESVQELPLYHQAQGACRRGHYHQAADLLARLSKTPNLSSEQRAFCLEQQQICLNHLQAGNVAKPVPAVSSVKPGPNPPTSSADCGPRALLLACQQLGVPASLPTLSKAAGLSSKGVSFEGLKRASESLGIKAEGVQVSREALPDIAVPAIAWVHGRHFVQIVRFSGRGESGTVTIHDPNNAQTETLAQEQLLQQCGGYLLLLRK